MRQNFQPKRSRSSSPVHAGGATDLIFRALAATTGKYLGKAVIVVNRPGGGGAVGCTEAAQAKPDGYTLVSAITPLTILPHQVKTAFTYKSFEPCHQCGERPIHVSGEVGCTMEES